MSKLPFIIALAALTIVAVWTMTCKPCKDYDRKRAFLIQQPEVKAWIVECSKYHDLDDCKNKAVGVFEFANH